MIHSSLWQFSPIDKRKTRVINVMMKLCDCGSLFIVRRASKTSHCHDFRTGLSPAPVVEKKLDLFPVIISLIK